jgi:hypothetical protein
MSEEEQDESAPRESDQQTQRDVVVRPPSRNYHYGPGRTTLGVDYHCRSSLAGEYPFEHSGAAPQGVHYTTYYHSSNAAGGGFYPPAYPPSTATASYYDDDEDDEGEEEELGTIPAADKIKIYIKAHPRSPPNNGKGMHPNLEKLMKHRERKNAMSRARAQELREKVEKIKSKGKMTMEEEKISKLHEERRRRKNERSRERSMQKKAETDRILNKPEHKRTKLDSDFLFVTLSQKHRKNEGDRNRRRRKSGYTGGSFSSSASKSPDEASTTFYQNNISKDVDQAVQVTGKSSTPLSRTALPNLKRKHQQPKVIPPQAPPSPHAPISTYSNEKNVYTKVDRPSGSRPKPTAAVTSLGGPPMSAQSSPHNGGFVRGIPPPPPNYYDAPPYTAYGIYYPPHLPPSHYHGYHDLAPPPPEAGPPFLPAFAGDPKHTSYYQQYDHHYVVHRHHRHYSSSTDGYPTPPEYQYDPARYYDDAKYAMPPPPCHATSGEFAEQCSPARASFYNTGTTTTPVRATDQSLSQGGHKDDSPTTKEEEV